MTDIKKNTDSSVKADEAEKQKPKKIKSVRDVIIESIECEPGIEGCTADPETCPNDPSICDKKLSMFGYYDETIKEDVEDVLGQSINRFSEAIKTSSKRWEMAVYPSLFAFVLLASYGFFLIYSLTQDVSKVAIQMESMSYDMHSIVVSVESMNKNMVLMTQILDSQYQTVQDMNVHIKSMDYSMSRMGYDMSIMNSNVSRPMNFMNSFMPW